MRPNVETSLILKTRAKGGVQALSSASARNAQKNPQDEVALQRTCMHLLASCRERSRGMGFGASGPTFSPNPREEIFFAVADTRSHGAAQDFVPPLFSACL